MEHGQRLPLLEGLVSEPVFWTSESHAGGPRSAPDSHSETILVFSKVFDCSSIISSTGSDVSCLVMFTVEGKTVE